MKSKIREKERDLATGLNARHIVLDGFAANILGPCITTA